MFAFLALVVELFSAALSKFGHVDLMVNNAGIMNENLVPQTIDINLVSTVDDAAKTRLSHSISIDNPYVVTS